MPMATGGWPQRSRKMGWFSDRCFEAPSGGAETELAGYFGELTDPEIDKDAFMNFTCTKQVL
jgi:hypothetical protein